MPACIERDMLRQSGSGPRLANTGGRVVHGVCRPIRSGSHNESAGIFIKPSKIGLKIRIEQPTVLLKRLQDLTPERRKLLEMRLRLQQAQAAGPELREVKIFDVYRGEQAGEGKKSIAFSVAFQSPERTLSDEDAAALRQNVKHPLGVGQRLLCPALHIGRRDRLRRKIAAVGRGEREMHLGGAPALNGYSYTFRNG